MVSLRFGGVDGYNLELKDHDDVVVVRSNRRGARHDLSPLSRRSQEASSQLTPLFGFPASGVGVYAAPSGGAAELATVLHEDPEMEFAGSGLRDPYGAPIVYTENVFVKFADDLAPEAGERLLMASGFTMARAVGYAPNAFFAKTAPGTGRSVFDISLQLLARDDVDLCHPEVLRERSPRGVFPQQWHLGPAVIGGKQVLAHANVAEAWKLTQGEGTTICILDDGVDIDHREFASAGKIVAPHTFTKPRNDDPRPADGDNHGTGCGGVACADGVHGASGVAPKARLMPLCNTSGLGSQDEADALAWAADHGADVISCSWGPPCGKWWLPSDPIHAQVVPLPDNTRLAINHAVTTGRSGRGCVILWAAGNGNESVDNDGYAAYEKVIAVAACNDTGRRSVYSDFGNAVWCAFPSNDARVEGADPPLTPGIWTTDRTGKDGYNPGNLTMGDLGGDYVNSFGGTSSAAPGMAGVAALILSVNPELKWDEVRDVIKESCDKIDDTPGEYVNGRSKKYGYGRANAGAAVALARARNGGTPPVVSPPLTWRATPAPIASSRTDDIWFHTPHTGWLVNSNGQIMHTTDGGDSWREQFHDAGLYLRCVGFASDKIGWVGTLTAKKQLLRTSDGGATWTQVAGLPPLAPSAVCGLSVVNMSVAYAAGTNYPNRPARMMKTVDGGATWQAWEMAAHASLLIDTYFTSPAKGWVVGGKAQVPNPTRDDVKPVVLHTTDGGKTWVNQLAALEPGLPRGEWGWKIAFLNDRIGFVSLESFTGGAILKTTDGGRSWVRLKINDPQGNANLEGVGFADERHGWVGGWGSADFQGGFTSETIDGGQTWADANNVGKFINRFRFFGTPVTVGYASGLTVYKYSAEPARALPREAGPPTRFLLDNEPADHERPVSIPLTIPEGADSLTIDVWDRFGDQVRHLVGESPPASGSRVVEWAVDDDAGGALPAGSFILRVTVDGASESQILRVMR